MPINAPIAVPLINGATWSFAHIKLRIAGIEFTGGFRSIKYKRTRAREYQRSNHPDPTAKSLGENTYEASAEMWLEWYWATIRTVEATLGKGYGDRFFPIFVSYGARGFAPHTDTIIGCTIDESDFSHATGPSPLVAPVNFMPLKVLWDGKDDCENPLRPFAA